MNVPRLVLATASTLVAFLGLAAHAQSPADNRVAAHQPLKWHPGHYVLVRSRAPQDSYIYTGFLGIQKFYNWRTLEPQKDLAAYAPAHGIGLGGPDIFIHDPLLNDRTKGVYRLYGPASGIVPLGTAVQPEDYLVKQFRGPADPPTPKELYEFGRDKLHLNYMFWSTRSGYFEKVQAMMADPSFPKDPAGGLSAVRPTGITGAAARPSGL